ncbi:MAG: hypothetical protein IPL16_11430 [Ignavibacteria bacterium]|nr:hypothetical protein [Ignavibacteria bacterium]
MEQSIISSNIPAKFLFALEKLSLNIRICGTFVNGMLQCRTLHHCQGTSEANSMIKLVLLLRINI